MTIHTVDDLSVADPPSHSVDELPATDLHGDTPAEILFTSGTTAAPKPVLLSHRNILYFGHEVKLHTAMRPTDDVLAVLPGDDIQSPCGRNRRRVSSPCLHQSTV
jgi:long-subunit acyl-CoA synthetase (AMP-forming)